MKRSHRFVACSLPPLLFLSTLATVFLFGGDRSHFYRQGIHNWQSSKVMALAENLSPDHGFKLFSKLEPKEDGTAGYEVYSRFPVGGYLLIKLAGLPFGDHLAEKIFAARMLMLTLFCTSAVLAYLALSRLVASRWISAGAVALAFSSQQSLYFADAIDTEGVCGLFGFMLVFHGMALFHQEGRFRQLLVKTGVALLLDWHVYALLLPFIVCGVVTALHKARFARSSAKWSLANFQVATTLLVLGAFSLMFGVAVLGFNLINEHLALGARESFANLPTFTSMMRRVGLWEYHPVSPWAAFLELQFHRIGRMSIPYALSSAVLHHLTLVYGDFQLFGVEWRSLIVAVGVFATGGALLGLLFIRQRMLLVVLVLSGFCWAVPMRVSTYVPFHDFESLYYIGVPLVFFSLVLLGVRRLLGVGAVVGLTAAALVAFALSSYRMSLFGHDAEATKRQAEVMADAAIIREMIKGESVLVPIAKHWEEQWDIHSRFAGDGSWAGRWALEYYLSGSVFRYDYELPEAHGQFVVSSKRSERGVLLTPGNRHLFLYEWFDIDAAYLSEYGRLVADDPLVRAHFDLYLHGKELSYVRAPCRREETDPWFFLHVIPLVRGDRPENLEKAWVNLEFRFPVRGGRLFHGKCMVTVDLPDYDISRIRTGQQVSGKGVIWEVAVDLPTHAL